MAKSNTWKRDRDERQRVAESDETVPLSELDALLEGTPWERGWCDCHEGAQIGIVFLDRPDIDEHAVVHWPAYAGWGESSTQIPRGALKQTKQLIESPPPPQIKPATE